MYVFKDKMDAVNKVSQSDDEEDLEALRLAALQSLKKKSIPNGNLQVNQFNADFPSHENELETLRHGNRLHKNFVGKRGRYFPRGLKNGQFVGSRIRTNNLISITPIDTNDEKEGKPDNSSNAKFSRPQDRYCVTGKATDDTKVDEPSSKFDRYNDSDKSEEESEDETPKSDSNDDSPSKLERSDSLEALMQELDDEIQGRNKSKEKEEKAVKVKLKVKKKKNTIKDNILNLNVQKEPEKEKQETENITAEVKQLPSDVQEIAVKEKPKEEEPQVKKRKHSPAQKDFHGFRRNIRRSPTYQQPPYLANILPIQYPPNAGPPIYNPSFGSQNVLHQPINPIPFYERPLSPLLINADTLQTQTMAPLSPRSAAFVLENRAIVEKRKRSPRRSYSRSPSPRRRSLTPSSLRRSLSPRRRSRSPKRRSISPRRRSPSPKLRPTSPKVRPYSPKCRPFSPKPRSFSPKQRVVSPKQRPLSPKGKPPISPKQRRFSPKLRSVSPKRRSVSPRRKDKKESGHSPKNRPSVRDRLGFKISSKSENKESKEKTLDSSPKKDDKPLDPILEARKRKFETKEIQVKEGVIRLKPKEDPKTEKLDEGVLNVKKEETDPPMVEEDNTALKIANLSEELLHEYVLADDELELEPKVDLFSDEESGSENEGRFKTKQETISKPAVLPFTKLINGTKKDSKDLEVIVTKENKPVVKSNIHSQASTQKKSTSKGSRTVTKDVKKPKSHKASLKNQIVVRSERHPAPKKFERKIEIKIKNPSKYEKEEDPREEKRLEEKKEKGDKNSDLENKVKVEEVEEDDFETEIVVENDEDEVENTIKNEDLRAQLSKKRAEKLHKNSTKEGVSSRLLQNALQNALPLKKSKKSKSQELSSSDGKLPIHLRLGVTCSSDGFNKPKRKLRKRKNVETEDQV